MEKFENLLPENLYHSYIIEGDPENDPLLLREFFKQRGEITENSPDIFWQIYDSLTIEDSHLIKEWHSKKKIIDSKKICILGAKFINREAEQSLLKILEEPAIDTHFFLIVPNSSLLLGTIKSRAHLIKIERDEKKKEIVEKFLKMSISERLDFISKLVKEKDKDENSGNLRFEATNLVNEIEKIIYQKFKKEKGGGNNIFILEELQKRREYLGKPGSSVKMILEHIALILN